jgi:hypothetical protein
MRLNKNLRREKQPGKPRQHSVLHTRKNTLLLLFLFVFFFSLSSYPF